MRKPCQRCCAIVYQTVRERSGYRIRIGSSADELIVSAITWNLPIARNLITICESNFYHDYRFRLNCIKRPTCISVIKGGEVKSRTRGNERMPLRRYALSVEQHIEQRKCETQVHLLRSIASSRQIVRRVLTTDGEHHKARSIDPHRGTFAAIPDPESEKGK